MSETFAENRCLCWMKMLLVVIWANNHSNAPSNVLERPNSKVRLVFENFLIWANTEGFIQSWEPGCDQSL